MKKSIWKKLAAVSMATVMCVGVGVLAACSDSEAVAGPQGPKGEAGNTPYIGADGYWYIGDVKTDTKAQGAAGVTPTVEIKDGYWYINGENTEVKASGSSSSSIVEIKDGYWYIDGENTNVKAEGTNGSSGVTPHIGENGNWFIGDEDTGVKAQGANGSDGTTPTITISSDGYWVINGEKTDTKAQGERGEEGPHGDVGTMWFTGRGLPTDAVNKDLLVNAREGDFYINTNTNTIYTFGSDNKWTVLVNVNEQHNVSVWDGTIPGWQNPTLSDEEIINNRPVSYVVDDNAQTVDIYNAEAFAWFAYRSVIGKTGYAGWTITLHCDIDLNHQMWVPIGLGARSNAAGVAFQGTFDGNGHTVYNLSSEKFYEGISYGEFENLLSTEENKTETGWYINVQNEYLGNHVNVNVGLQLKDNEKKEADEFSFGLFGSTYNATIKNLNVENVHIDLPEKTVNEGKDNERSCIGDSTGAIVGYAQYNLTMENCRVGYEGCEGTIAGAKCAGGLLGRFYGGKDGNGKDQYVDGVKTYDHAYYGALSIKNCVNYLGVGEVGIDKKAGIVGYPGYFSALTIENCTNYGKIVGQYAGGIMGFRGTGTNVARGSVTVSDCTNYGEIIGTTAGGILGVRSTTGGAGNNPFFIFRNCNNFGNVTGTSFGKNAKIYVGGLIGEVRISNASGVILDCFNYGNIKVDDSYSGITEVYAGGIFGYFTIDNSASFVIAAGNSGNVTVKAAANTLKAGAVFGSEIADGKLNLPYGSIINTGVCTVAETTD